MRSPDSIGGFGPRNDARLRAALQRAVDAIGSLRVFDAAYQDVSSRLAAEPGDMVRPSTRAGIMRTLDHYLSAEVHDAAPEWRRVRALHRAWLAARAYDDAGRALSSAAGAAPPPASLPLTPGVSAASRTGSKNR